MFQDNFDAEGPGSTLSYSSFTNWTVTAGDVDIIANTSDSATARGVARLTAPARSSELHMDVAQGLNEKRLSPKELEPKWLRAWVQIMGIA